MGRTILYILLIIGSQPIFGQETISTLFLEPGDTLNIIETKVRHTSVPTQSGRNARWNFMFLDAPYVKEILFNYPAAGEAFNYFKDSDVVAIGVNQEETYYKVAGGQVIELGRYGLLDWLNVNRSIVKYDPRPVIKKGGLAYNDRYTDRSTRNIKIPVSELRNTNIGQLPLSGDSIMIRMQVLAENVIDGSGELLLPFGSYHVLRERSELKITTEVLVPGDMGWESLDENFGNHAFGIKTGTETKTNYRFWASNYPMPVLTLEELNADEYKIVFVNDDQSQRIFTAKSSTKDIIALPNPTLGQVSFEFINFSPGTYKLQVSNIVNKPIFTKEYQVGSNLKIEEDLSFLRKGTYLYSIYDSRGNKLFTKKIVIIRV